MDTVKKFLTDMTFIEDMLVDVGYMTDSVVQALSMIGELCIIGLILDDITKKYKELGAVPSKFSVNIDIPNLTIHRKTVIDIKESLENKNITVFSRGEINVMTSRVISHLFKITGGDGVRNVAENVNNDEPILLLLSKIENEIISSIHNNIDIVELEMDKISEELSHKKIYDMYDEIMNIYENLIGDENELLKIPLVKEKDIIIDKYTTYFFKLFDILPILKREEETQREVIRCINKYPRSFITRQDSSNSAIFKEVISSDIDHPLTIIFKKAISDTYGNLRSMSEMYHSYLIDSVDKLLSIPRLSETHQKIYKNSPEEIDQYERLWKNIEKYKSQLNIQSSVIKGMVNSIDNLFLKEKKDGKMVTVL